MGLPWRSYSVSVGLRASHVLSQGVGVLAEEALVAPSCSSVRNPPSGDSSVSLAQAGQLETCSASSCPAILLISLYGRRIPPNSTVAIHTPWLGKVRVTL